MSFKFKIWTINFSIKIDRINSEPVSKTLEAISKIARLSEVSMDHTITNNFIHIMASGGKQDVQRFSFFLEKEFNAKFIFEWEE